ncbi:leukocyte antigen CD37 [Chanos chanos]|uniref:Leukocyte antigen CD37 n=1 Tax=Chanos chanos TaxID=29144 RepID=A0A6J2VG78_CHACN|nr:CD82 antigen-like [Chanos chanos]
MASECCVNLTKYLLFLFNLVFFILGLVMLSMGLWILFAETRFFGEYLTELSFMSLSLLSYLLLIGGSVTMSLAFFGCLGSLKEVKCMLGVYFLLLTCLLAAQIVGGVLLFTQKSVFEDTLKQHVTQLIKQSGKNESAYESFERTMEFIQEKSQCCGWDESSEWEKTPCSCYYNSYNSTLNVTNTQPCACDSDFTQCQVFDRGCGEVIKDWVKGNMWSIIGVIIGTAVIEGLQWVFLLTFCCLKRKPRLCCPVKTRDSHVQLSRSLSAWFCAVVLWRIIHVKNRFLTSAALALRCNHCVNINQENPSCDTVEERECGMNFNNCARITMHPPAYGEVRKCATDTECAAKVPSLVEKHCCNTDLCN